MQTVETDRALYAACMAVFRTSGWWSEQELAEYGLHVGKIMKGGNEGEKKAARDFWASRIQ